MAFRLKGRKRLDAELSRIVAKEFARASEDLSARNDRHLRFNGHPAISHDEAVHDARKSIKKIRAVLRLLQHDLGKDYDLWNQRLRNIAHELSPVRDANATVEIAESLREHYPELMTRSVFGSVHRQLMSRSYAAAASFASRHVLPRTIDEMRQSAQEATKAIRRAAGAGAIRAGVLRGYRRARKALAAVQTQREDVLFHVLRRRVKEHWYHVRLFEGLVASARQRAHLLKQLETTLGDDHNLVVMRTAILARPSRFGRQRATTLVLGCVDTYEDTLRRRALELGARLFGRRPAVFRRTVDSWQRAAKQAARSQ